VPGRVATEEDPTPTEGMAGGRGRNAQALLDLADRDVRSAVVRLPRTVHNEGKGGFAGVLTDIARRTGVAGYPGDGTQRWPAVHAINTAVLFRLALENAPAGSILHAVADEGDQVRDIVNVIGRRPACRARPSRTRRLDRSLPSSSSISPPRATTPANGSAGRRRIRAFWRISSGLRDGTGRGQAADGPRYT
jgi:nucleoside-diphosphate-sugar epimerase